MEEIKDDMLKRTKRMISLCRNADVLANRLVMTLADQGERLVDIQTHLVSVEATLTDTKKSVNRLKGITQRVFDRFRKRFHRKIRFHSREQQASSPLRRPLPVQSMQPNILASNSITDDQIDEALYQINQLILSLKDRAYIINDQLVEQAETIDHLHESMIESTDHIQEQNLDMKKLSLKN